MIKKTLFILFLLTPLIIGITIYSQSLSKVRGDKKRIKKIIKKNAGDKESLEDELEAFDVKSLRIFLKAYDLPIKDKKKSELIKLLIENLSLIAKGKSEGKLPKSSAKKDGRSPTGRRRDEIPAVDSKGKKGVLLYKAQKVYFVNKKDKKGFRRVFLFGKVVLKFNGKTIRADAVTIKIDEKDDPIEAIAIGDILLTDKSGNRVVGVKIFFFPQIKRSVIHKGIAYSRPFYLTGEIANQVSDSKFIFYNGFMTTGNIKHPHYSLNYSKAWFYTDEFIWAEDVTYVIGNTPLLYTPFFFRSSVTTGIRTAFGFERGINWFLHNTLVYIPGQTAEESLKSISKGSNAFTLRKHKVGMKFKADYYQRMGFYFGYELLYKKGVDKILIDSAVALDRSLEYIGGSRILTNNFDQDRDGISDPESNNFRWRINLDGTFGLFTSNGFNSVFKVLFKNQGEPFFQSQFEKRRKVAFDLFKIFGIDRTYRDIEGASLGFGSITGQQIKLSLANKIGGLTVTLSADFNYLLQLDNTDSSNPPTNPFKTGSYKNYKSIFTVPQVRVAYSDFIQILGKTKPKLASQKKKEDKAKSREIDIFLKEFESKGTYSPIIPKNQQTAEDIVGEDKYLPPKLKRKNHVLISLPLTYTASFDFSERKSYNTSLTNTLASDIFNTTETFTISTPFSLTYRFLVFKVTTSETIKNLNQDTKNATTIQSDTDSELTYASWSTNLSSNVELHFFDKYKYLELILGGGVRYSKANRFDKVRKVGVVFKNETGRSETLGFDTNLTFFKTKFSVGFTDNIHISATDEEQIALGNTTANTILKSQRGNLVLTVRSETLKFLTATNTFTRSRREGKDISNKVDFNFKLIGRTHLFGPIYINSLTQNFSWLNDFQNPRGSNLTSTFSIDFNISKDWNFIYQATSSNKQLYRYSSSLSQQYGQTSRDFFGDLLDSFNFFNLSARENSLFNLERMSFKLRHDLHDWMMEFSVDLTVKQFRNGPYYFEPTLYFIIRLKDLPSFSYPKIKRTFTKQ